MKSQKDIEFIKGRIDALTEGFQRGFKQVQTVTPDRKIPVLGWEGIEGETAIHQEIRGEGDTPEAALLDWKHKLDELPQVGRAIFWRVLPEVNYDYRFDTKQTHWQVYTRVAIFK